MARAQRVPFGPKKVFVIFTTTFRNFKKITPVVVWIRKNGADPDPE
jgi:hypothetical protein